MWTASATHNLKGRTPRQIWFERRAINIYASVLGWVTGDWWYYTIRWSTTLPINDAPVKGLHVRDLHWTLLIYYSLHVRRSSTWMGDWRRSTHLIYDDTIRYVDLRRSPSTPLPYEVFAYKIFTERSSHTSLFIFDDSIIRWSTTHCELPACCDIALLTLTLWGSPWQYPVGPLWPWRYPYRNKW